MPSPMENIFNAIQSRQPPTREDEEEFSLEELGDLSLNSSGRLLDPNRAKSASEYLKTQAQIGFTEGNAILGALGEILQITCLVKVQLIIKLPFQIKI